MTTEPPVVLPPPKVAQAVHRLVAPGIVDVRVRGLLDDPLFSPKGTVRELRRDLFIDDELLDLDLNDDDALIAFLNAHGVLLPTPNHTQSAIRSLIPPEERHVLEAELDRVVARTKRSRDWRLHSTRALGVELRIARALTWHWILAENKGDVTNAWRKERLNPAENERYSYIRFRDVLSKGLSPFHVRVDIEGVRTGPALPIDLFNGLCFQLRNTMTEELVPKFCSNEKCGRPFVHQDGRAQKERYRSKGVFYCTRKCALAQAKREERRRKR